ncbi:MAG: CHAT domain-containing protein [Acidobacteriia bacterium]|nr:CHAT domain-containing protein [Terriglobia bacterium]
MAASPDQPANIEELIGALAQEPDAGRRRLLLSRPEWRGAEIVERLYDETVRLTHVDLGQAERLAKSAAWLSRRVRDEAARALGLRALGHIQFLRGRHAPAWRFYEAAIEIYERLGKETELGRTLHGGSLQTLIYLGRYDEAFAFAERARAIFSRQGDRLRLARLDSNMGNVLFRLDRFEEALELYHRAYEALVELGDPQNVALTLKNMATCQISVNEFGEALETYGKARAWCVEHNMPLVVAEADYNIAYLYYLRGEYARALELYAATREHCAALGDEYHQGLCDLDQSEMYLELNLSEEGAHLARRALATFRQLGVRYESAKAMTNLAIATSHHGVDEAALDLFRKARELFTRENNQVWTAMVDLYQALVMVQKGRLEEGRVLCRRAFRFFSGSPFVGKAALCQLLVARIHLNAGRPQEAKRACLDALERAEQAESPTLSYQGYFVLGQIEEMLGASDAAYEAYLKAHERLENLRSQLNAEEMKIAFLKDKLAVYESLVGMCLGRGPSAENLEAAFGYIEQAKSRSLADLIASRGSQIPARRETHRVLVEQIGALRERLNWYTGAIRLMEGRSPNARDAHLENVRRAARDCERRLVEALYGLRADDREFADIHAAGSITLDDIRSSLPRDAMLVQFYRVRDVFHACLLSASKLKIVPLGSAAQLRRSLQLLRFQLSKFRLGAGYVQTFHRQLLEAANAHLQDFYQQLVSPIEHDLEGEHLIIAPHDFLHYLPFQALYDGGGYLGDRFSISYTPSGSVYYLCSTKRTPVSDRALILGVPDPSAPHILDEVRAVASVLPNPEVLVGADARQEALSRKGPNCRFIHIATHGWFRQDNPMFSSISLGDSQLNLFDLYQLNLPAELVTLSGCGTGLNVVVGGDELLGLKRGLLYAGAQGVLLTLWDVNDQSTAEFMRLFYDRLRSVPDKAKAIQYAMGEIRKSYPHPFYWAPFVLVGSYS